MCRKTARADQVSAMFNEILTKYVGAADCLAMTGDDRMMRESMLTYLLEQHAAEMSKGDLICLIAVAATRLRDIGAQ